MAEPHPSPSGGSKSISITVACCQVAVAVGDGPANRERLRDAVARAADAGARVAVLPELANTGYMFNDLDELRGDAEPEDGPTVSGWAELARQRELIIVGGFAETGDDGRVYNSAVLVDETGLRAKYRKGHLWDWEKNNLIAPGPAHPHQPRQGGAPPRPSGTCRCSRQDDQRAQPCARRPTTRALRPRPAVTPVPNPKVGEFRTVPAD